MKIKKSLDVKNNNKTTSKPAKRKKQRRQQDVYVKKGYSFAFDIITQSLRAKYLSGIDFDQEIKMLLQVLGYKTGIESRDKREIKSRINTIIKKAEKIGYKSIPMFETMDKQIRLILLEKTLDFYFQTYSELFHKYPDFLEVDSLDELLIEITNENGIIKSESELNLEKLSGLYEKLKASNIVDSKARLFKSVFISCGMSIKFENKKQIKVLSGLIGVAMDIIDHNEYQAAVETGTEKDFLSDSMKGAVNKLIKSGNLSKGYFDELQKIYSELLDM